MKKLLLLLALSGCVAAGHAQEILLGTDFKMYFDNKEFGSNEFAVPGLDIESGTDFAARLTPRVGIRWDEKNTLVIAADMIKNFGTQESAYLSEIKPVFYYQFQTPKVTAAAGIFTRDMMHDDYSTAFFSESERFFHNRMNGVLAQYNGKRNSYVEFVCDWEGMYSTLSREKFRILLAGRHYLDTFYYGFNYSMFHYAGQQGAPIENVVDLQLLNPCVGVRFNAFFDFNEAAVVGQVGHATSQFGTFRITFSDSYPRIFAQLFQAQGYTGTFAVELQHFNSDFVAHVDDFARMLNAFPGHVSDVQQAVNAAQINECTVVSEVLNDTFNFHAFLQVFQQLIALCAVFGFDNGTTRNNNVVALLIQLDYFEFKLFAFQVQSVTHRTNVYQRTWQERTNTVQLNSEAALNFAVDNTGNSFSIFVSFFQRDPGFVTFSFLTGQQSFTEAVFYCVQSNVNFVTYLDFQLALGVFELLSRDGGLRFQTSVNQYYVFVDSNNNATNDRTRAGFDFF